MNPARRHTRAATSTADWPFILLLVGVAVLFVIAGLHLLLIGARIHEDRATVVLQYDALFGAPLAALLVLPRGDRKAWKSLAVMLLVLLLVPSCGVTWGMAISFDPWSSASLPEWVVLRTIVATAVALTLPVWILVGGGRQLLVYAAGVAVLVVAAATIPPGSTRPANVWLLMAAYTYVLVGGVCCYSTLLCNRRGEPARRCNRCGYSQNGLPSGVPCPECGDGAAE